jgi:hypothetical protein
MCGALANLLTDDPGMEWLWLSKRAIGSMSVFMVMDKLSPCRNCTHPQGLHDDEGRCTFCACGEFRYEEVPDD